MDKISLGDVFTLKKDWTFPYSTEPYEMAWKKGASFKVVGFQSLFIDEKVFIELQDEHGRLVGMTNDVAVHLLDEPQLSLFD